MKNFTFTLLCFVVLLSLIDEALSQPVNIPNKFSSGEIAVASDVNENFSVLASEIDNVKTNLTSTITDLNQLKTNQEDIQLQLSSLNSSNIILKNEITKKAKTYSTHSPI